MMNLFRKTLLALMTLSTVLVSSCLNEEDPAPEPTASFSFVRNGFNVTFTNSSQNSESYIWDFGDGEASTSESPSKTYTNNGSYTVKLTSVGEGGTASSTQVITIDVKPEPQADFSFEVNGYNVTFNNESQNATRFVWDFGDGNSEEVDSPVYNYFDTGNGTYEVTLTATGENDVTSLVTKQVIISAPVAKFSMSVDALTVTFTNESENAASSSWSFGDGSQSTETSPTKTYGSSGTYTVELTITSEESIIDRTSMEVTVEESATSVPIPDSHRGDFYDLDGDFQYRFGRSLILDPTDTYFFDDTEDVVTSQFNGWTIYQITGTNALGKEKRFWIHQKSRDPKERNKLYVSDKGATSGYREYAKVSGISLKRANFSGGAFINTRGNTWVEQFDNGTSNNFTETSRDQWSVFLEKSDGAKVIINVNDFIVQFKSTTASSFRNLYTIRSVQRTP